LFLVLCSSSACFALAVRATPANEQRSKNQDQSSFLYDGSITQQFDIAGCDQFIGGDALLDFNQIAFRLAQLNQPLFRMAVLDNK